MFQNQNETEGGATIWSQRLCSGPVRSGPAVSRSEKNFEFDELNFLLSDLVFPRLCFPLVFFFFPVFIHSVIMSHQELFEFRMRGQRSWREAVKEGRRGIKREM